MATLSGGPPASARGGDPAAGAFGVWFVVPDGDLRPEVLLERSVSACAAAGATRDPAGGLIQYPWPRHRTTLVTAWCLGAETNAPSPTAEINLWIEPEPSTAMAPSPEHFAAAVRLERTCREKFRGEISVDSVHLVPRFQRAPIVVGQCRPAGETRP